MKISVIVPVYNVEQYLKECLDSIINQDYRNLEIILINDGSTDSSGNICDNYAQIDSRITVIHQENAGPSTARNKGLKCATGDYISFIDSDDWIDFNMYSTIVKYLTNDNSVDVVYMPYPITKENSIIHKYSKTEIREKLVQHFIGREKISLGRMSAVWTLIIRKSLTEDLQFTNISYCEDKIFFIEILLKTNTLLSLSQTFYNYRYNPQSITNKYYKTYTEDMTFAHKAILNILIKYNINNQRLMNRYNNTIISIYYHLIKNESFNKELIIPNPSLKKYYIDNNIDELLTWQKTFKAILNKPKIFLIKLGFSDYVLKKRWLRNHKKETSTI